MNQPTHRFGASLTLAGLVGALALAPAALAQDSTCKTSGLPGDALDAKDTGEQVANFVVDLQAIQSSWNNTFGVAPLLKTSEDFVPAPQYYNVQLGSQAISTNQLTGVPYARSSYALWSAPGGGVNTDAARNDPGTPTAPPAGTSSQFALAFDEFGADPGLTIDFGSIVTGVVNYDPNTPSRLYVSRVNAGTNGPNYTDACASFGMGGVDASGMVMMRADGFGNLPGLSCTPVGNGGPDSNYFRLDTLSRAGAALNVISDSGGSDAGASLRLLTNASTTHSVCGIVPSAVTGGAPIILGSNFSDQYVYGTASPLTATSSHLGGDTSQRGAIAYYQGNFGTLFPGSVNGTIAQIGESSGTGFKDRIHLSGLAGTGASLGAISRQIPAGLMDLDDGWPVTFLGPGSPTFTHYSSQTAFQGGTAQVAVGKDLLGNVILAGTAVHPVYTSNDQEDLAILAAQIDPTTGSTVWTVAAYAYDTGDCLNAGTQGGKAIYDGATGAVVGNLLPYTALGSTVCGPSISPPMIDSAGNILFVAAVDVGGDTGVGLVRAVLYDQVNFKYRLELIFQSGDVFHGQNSDRDYLVRFLELTEGPGASGPSIDSAAPFSGNIIQTAWNNLNPSMLSADDSKTVGGVAIGAGIIYDVDDDGQFDDIDNTPGSADQDYQVVLFITAADDCNENGVPDDLDILNATSTDTNGDGIPDECSPGTGRCFCDIVNAPCGNAYPTGGCQNSTGVGAIIVATGSNSVAAQGGNPLVLHVTQGRPNKNYQFLQGAGPSIQSAFRDGNLCVGNPTIRLPGFGCGPVPIGTFDSTGSVSTDDVVQGFDILSADTCKGGTIASQVAGTGSATRDYQTWFRDGMGPCATGSNLTNATQVTWVP